MDYFGQHYFGETSSVRATAASTLASIPFAALDKILGRVESGDAAPASDTGRLVNKVLRLLGGFSMLTCKHARTGAEGPPRALNLTEVTSGASADRPRADAPGDGPASAAAAGTPGAAPAGKASAGRQAMESFYSEKLRQQDKKTAEAAEAAKLLAEKAEKKAASAQHYKVLHQGALRQIEKLETTIKTTLKAKEEELKSKELTLK